MRFTRERRPRPARFNDHSLCETSLPRTLLSRALHTRRPTLKRVGGDRRRAMRNGIYHKLRSKMSLGPWRTRVCTPALPTPRARLITSPNASPAPASPRVPRWRRRAPTSTARATSCGSTSPPRTRAARSRWRSYPSFVPAPSGWEAGDPTP